MQTQLSCLHFFGLSIRASSRDREQDTIHYQQCVDRLDDDQRHLVLRDLTIDLCASAVVPPIATPRSLGLAHLRTALWFHAESPLARFVTLDQVQAGAAVELGLPA